MTLLVEDDPGIRRVVRCMLQQIGCVVWEATDGQQAIEAVAVAFRADEHLSCGK